MNSIFLKIVISFGHNCLVKLFIINALFIGNKQIRHHKEKLKIYQTGL